MNNIIKEEEQKNEGKPPRRKRLSAWASMSWPGRAFLCIKIPIRAVWCVSNIFVFLFGYFGLILPIIWAKNIWPRLYWGCEGYIYSNLQAFIGYWGYTAGYDVIEYGDDLTDHGQDDRVLMIINHQSTADVPVVFALLQNKGVAKRKTIWLMDTMFKYTPFGMIGTNHGDYFITQGRASRNQELDRLGAHLNRVFWDRDRRWVVLFPEGGFYYKRVRSSQEYARKHNYPHLEHTTLPRMGAMQRIMETIGPRVGMQDRNMNKPGTFRLIKDTVGAIRDTRYIKETRPPISYILDVTIAYPDDDALGLWTLCLGTRERCEIGVNYRMHKAEDVPFEDDEALRKWMYDRYVEKDKILDTYYRQGVFHVGEIGNRIHFPWWKIAGQYCFWFGCFFLHFKVYAWLVFRMLAIVSSIFSAIV